MKYVVAMMIALLPPLLAAALMGPRMIPLVLLISAVAAWVYLSDKVGRRERRA